MGKDWDKGVPCAERWAAFLNLLKPGGHLLAFAGTRTHHRMASAIEDGGFEIRDMIAWMYGTGFPKSMDVSKAIDKAAGAERTQVVGSKLGRPGMAKDGSNQRSGFDSAFGEGEGTPMDHNVYAPATDAAKQWQGWGTALKPALEPITVARKPVDGTVAANVQQHGTGAINVDRCRVGTEVTTTIRSGNSGAHGRYGVDDRVFTRENPPGRWPANLIHDGSDEVLSNFPKTGQSTGGTVRTQVGVLKHGGENDRPQHAETGGQTVRPGYEDQGTAARFFYCAKASQSERGETNNHPTVKPIELMRYLCRLITPPDGIVFDPYTGSGSTALAAYAEGFRFVGIEKDQAYCDIAVRRIVESLKG